MNHPDSMLKNFIHVERGIIPAELCDEFVQKIEKKDWKPHEWYNPNIETVVFDINKELDCWNPSYEEEEPLMQYVMHSGTVYTQKYAYPIEQTNTILHGIGRLRFNRYAPGQIMRQHQDHIYSMFDGKQRGIPILSFVLNLNDDYEGAEIFFWDDYVVPLGKGDILVFPSLFLYPHGVREATKGKRYSAVCWGF